MAKTYSEKLQDPRWQRKRLEILSRDDFACQRCMDDETTLHVHHFLYINGREPWEYDNSLLITLCKDCHEHETSVWRDYEKMLIDSLRSKGIFSDDFSRIADGILKMPIIFPAEVTASIIAFAFENINEIAEMYFSNIKPINKTNGKNKID